MIRPPVFGNHVAAAASSSTPRARGPRPCRARVSKLPLEIFERRIDVSLVGHAFENVEDGGARALDRVARDAEFLGDRVGGAKADAVNGAREHVGIAPHDVERFLAVELVDAPRVRRADVRGRAEKPSAGPVFERDNRRA